MAQVGLKPLSEILHRELSNAQASKPASVEILDELAGHGFSEPELSEFVVPRRTLARRRQADGKLSTEESDRAVRLARLTERAERIFGDPAKAHRWLRKRSPMLAGSVPLEMMKTETGAHLVEQALYRIEYGMFA